MGKKRALPIGMDDFRKVREGNFYYADKTMMIQDFIEMQNEVALIARPRRFGKTLNMTMIRDFFDITRDSREIFAGLNIMATAYADQINSRPVVYFTFKDCKGETIAQMVNALKASIYQEYLRYEKIFREKLDKTALEIKDFYEMINVLRSSESDYDRFQNSIKILVQFVEERYGIRPILLIDEYDAPIMSSYESGYHEKLGSFFPNLYGAAMKGNQALGQALLTGVQRVAKESIFSQFNNVNVYTVLDERYASYFGLTVSETERLLSEYELSLNETVRKKYNGYHFGGIWMYNPWSLLNYADRKTLKSYWINTSSNTLVRDMLKNANKEFWKDFDKLAAGKEVSLWITLETSYMEREDNDSLWGLLVNSGYLTAVESTDEKRVTVRIPNDEVMSEFQTMVAHLAGIRGTNLDQMFDSLLRKDMEQFIKIYRKIVLECTSFMDSDFNIKENAYHMLMLGMCVTLHGVYEVTSNSERGTGRYDILLKAIDPKNSHVLIEFKQGDNVQKLKEEALQQILDHQYYAGLTGEIICIGLAHKQLECDMAYKTLYVQKNLLRDMKGR